MKHYNLDEDEVLLYKGKVSFKNKSVETELVLTNKKFVFISVIQNEFMLDVVSVDKFSVCDVKQYQGNYQVKRDGNIVEIYFLHDEVEFVFEKGKRFTSNYRTPYGDFSMEVLTNDVVNNLTEEGLGDIHIDYHVSLSGMTEGRNCLSIEVTQ